MCCSNCSRFRETQPYKLALRNVRANLCGPCFTSLTDLGMVWVPTGVTVEHRRPGWLDRLTAKEIA